MVAAGKLMPDQSGPGLTACYDYSAPVQGEYLDGCVDGCHSFRTLQAPLRAHLELVRLSSANI